MPKRWRLTILKTLEQNNIDFWTLECVSQSFWIRSRLVPWLILIFKNLLQDIHFKCLLDIVSCIFLHTFILVSNISPTFNNCVLKISQSVQLWRKFCQLCLPSWWNLFHSWFEQTLHKMLSESKKGGKECVYWINVFILLLHFKLLHIKLNTVILTSVTIFPVQYSSSIYISTKLKFEAPFLNFYISTNLTQNCNLYVRFLSD